MGSKQGANGLLRKHIATIHCANTLSLLQRKISNALLFFAYDNLLIQEIHQISIKHLCHLIGYQGHNYFAIKEALRGLVSTSIEWNLIDDTGEDQWTASSILASVQLQGATCFYAYSPHMKHLLHSPQIYGVINLSVQAKFKSAYALALYENVSRYKNLSFTKWFDIDLFRHLMGVPEGQYPQFRDFKRRIIVQSLKEVNAHSDLIIASEIRKQGREVKAIRFKIETIKGRVIEIVGEGAPLIVQISPNLAVKLTKEYGFTQNKIQTLLESYTQTQILEKMALIEQSDAYKKGQVKNMAAYLLKALKDNYQIAVSSLLIQDKNQRQNAEKESQRKLAEEKKHQRQVAYDKYVHAAIKDYLGGLTVDAFQKLEQSFQKNLEDEKNHFCLNLFKQSHLKHSLVQVLFYNHVKAVSGDVFQDLLSFEDFFIG